MDLGDEALLETIILFVEIIKPARASNKMHAVEAIAENIDYEWRSTRYFSKKSGLSIHLIGQILRRLCAAGLIERTLTPKGYRLWRRRR